MDASLSTSRLPAGSIYHRIVNVEVGIGNDIMTSLLSLWCDL
jgi:hypothetical protein